MERKIAVQNVNNLPCNKSVKCFSNDFKEVT